MPRSKQPLTAQLVLIAPEDRPEPDVSPLLAERRRLAELWWSKHPTDNRGKGEQDPFPDTRG